MCFSLCLIIVSIYIECFYYNLFFKSHIRMLNSINTHQFQTKNLILSNHCYLRFKSTAVWAFSKCQNMKDVVTNYA